MSFWLCASHMTASSSTRPRAHCEFSRCAPWDITWILYWSAGRVKPSYIQLFRVMSTKFQGNSACVQDAWHWKNVISVSKNTCHTCRSHGPLLCCCSCTSRLSWSNNAVRICLFFLGSGRAHLKLFDRLLPFTSGSGSRPPYTTWTGVEECDCIYRGLLF